jgi:hypothetical protein
VDLFHVLGVGVDLVFHEVLLVVGVFALRFQLLLLLKHVIHEFALKPSISRAFHLALIVLVFSLFPQDILHIP